MLSDIFRPATWRGTTRVDAGTMGVSFHVTSTDDILRLKLDSVDARKLAESILEYLDGVQPFDFSQSPISSGSPSSDGSPQQGQSQ